MEKLGISWTKHRIYFVTSLGWTKPGGLTLITASFDWSEGHDHLVAPKEFVQWLD